MACESNPQGNDACDTVDEIMERVDMEAAHEHVVGGILREKPHYSSDQKENAKDDGNRSYHKKNSMYKS